MLRRLQILKRACPPWRRGATFPGTAPSCWSPKAGRPLLLPGGAGTALVAVVVPGVCPLRRHPGRPKPSSEELSRELSATCHRVANPRRLERLSCVRTGVPGSSVRSALLRAVGRRHNTIGGQPKRPQHPPPDGCRLHSAVSSCDPAPWLPSWQRPVRVLADCAAPPAAHCQLTGPPAFSLVCHAPLDLLAPDPVAPDLDVPLAHYTVGPAVARSTAGGDWV